jgi:hypothetical protein
MQQYHANPEKHTVYKYLFDIGNQLVINID